MSIFGRQTPAPTRINSVRINQSVLGLPVAVVMGRAKIQQAILWVDGYVSKLINTGGGKGFGGGKDGNQNVYTADVIAGLCAGPVTGIGDAWSGQTWLKNSNASVSVLIDSTLTYTPPTPSLVSSDQGVGVATAFTALLADIGSAGAGTTLSGTHVVPFALVPYGTALTSGQYSVNPATHAYTFAAADVGKTVVVAYGYPLAIETQQLTGVIPTGQAIAVGGTLNFQADLGVKYKTGPKDGQALVGVPYYTTPGVGEYTITGSAPAVYHFGAADVDAEVVITYQVQDAGAIPVGTPSSLDFQLYEGYSHQATLGLLQTNFAASALGYTGIAFAAYLPMSLGYDAQIQENAFEVLTADAWGGGIADCNPVQCILQVLTNTVWGLGAGAFPFPVGCIDMGSGGTWGYPLPLGHARQDSTATSWFAANGFFISPAIDQQDNAASVMSKWLEAGQCAAFMSEGLMKLVPYGDTSAAGNGAVWVAPSAFACALDDTCFIGKEGDDPVKISSSPWQDAFNTVQVSWDNRANQYAPEVTPESDQAAINRYGSRIEDPQSWDFIKTLASATFAASMRVKRSVYARNTYEFSLPYRYSYLEPMDIVTLTTSSLWAAGLNNLNLGVTALPVRVTKVVDNPDGTLDLECEDYPFGVNCPTIYNKGIAAGVAAPNQFLDPGNSEVVIFEATSRLTGFAGNQIWMGACGTASWGGCNVLASMDGVTYVSLGTIKAPARLGVLGAALPVGADPDTTDSVVFQLAENCAALDAGTTADADINNTLTFVDGELISYSACAVTGVEQCTATGYIRRGVLGSTIAAHAAGALFMRLDSSVFKYTYDPAWYGKTVYLKFQSFNVYGNSAQDLSTLTAVAFTVPGLNPGTVDASTGVVTSNHLPPNVAANVACNAQLGSESVTVRAGSASLTSLSIGVFGPGGGGTGWTFTVGSTVYNYPAGTIAGIDQANGGTSVFVIYDTKAGVYDWLPASSYSGILGDFYIIIGTITLATAGSSTGTTGTPGSPVHPL